MTRRMIFPLILGVVGAAVLCALGVWQLQRLAQKTDQIEQIEARISGALGPLPAQPTEGEHEYSPVEVGGRLVGDELHVLTSIKGVGPGFRVIQKLETLDGRSVMADLGFVLEAAKDTPRPEGAVFLKGNLLWPNETDSFTPAPNSEKNIWFARDNQLMSSELGTEPVMVVASEVVPSRGERHLPVQANLPNDHLQYAITWFSLMAVWIGMTLFLIYRIRSYEAVDESY